MSERFVRIVSMFDVFLRREKRNSTGAEMKLLEIIAAELDALESRIGSLKARPEEVAEWTDGTGVLEEERND